MSVVGGARGECVLLLAGVDVFPILVKHPGQDVVVVPRSPPSLLKHVLYPGELLGKPDRGLEGTTDGAVDDLAVRLPELVKP